MTTFLRLFSDKDKAECLALSCAALRAGIDELRVFHVEPKSFSAMPGAPFAYWAGQHAFQLFQNLTSYRDAGRTVRTTNPSTDDFRFARAWWEPTRNLGSRWRSWNKGGGFSLFYRDIDTVIDWDEQRSTYRGYTGTIYRPDIRPANLEYFARPGLTWVYRGSRLCVQAMPRGTVISTRGNGIYADADHLGFDLGFLNSSATDYLIKLTLGRNDHPQFDIGDINTIPVPTVSPELAQQMTALAMRGWSIKRTLDTINETSHAYLLPKVLRTRLGDFEPATINAEIIQIQKEIDDIAIDLYGFSKADRMAVNASQGVTSDDAPETSADVDGADEDKVAHIDQTAGLLSWAVGVVFGRFDWRLATTERTVPPEPEPFDPLPTKSPGMLPDGEESFHSHAGILVDDQGHPHYISRLVEEVLSRIDVSVPDDVRRWLRKDFFAFHLQHYSKSRRKAPIYWPLSTASGSYTLWIYYPSLNSQTLFTAVNDFLDGPNGKLTQVSRECAELRMKGSGCSRDEEKQYETLQAFEQELTDLRDTLLKIVPTYQPNHDDGVQITAAPLWSLFRHKPWQNVLKDTWKKLEKGDYDWAHLAMAYWPDRVREKCKTDKSLAIAHGLEALFVAPIKTGEGATK
jgi:hypothetical protein